MKKITIGLCIFLLSFNFVYAQTASVSDNIFTNIASTIANAWSSAIGYVSNLFNVSENKSGIIGVFEDGWKRQQDNWSIMKDCDEAKKSAGDYADEKDGVDKERTPGSNGEKYPYTSITSMYGDDGLRSGTKPITTPSTIPDILPKDGAFKTGEAWAATQEGVDNPLKDDSMRYRVDDGLKKDPCDELRRDKKAADDAAKDPNSKYSDEEQEKARDNSKNIQDAIDKCCYNFPIGGGSGSGKGGDTNPPIDITPPTDPNPPDDPGVPPEEPIDPGQPTPEDRYVCDFTSQSYNNLYNCIVASGPVKPGELVCDVNTNKEIPVTQEVEKTFLWIFPYTDTVTEMVTYNPACFWNDDGETPPPTGPIVPITPPVNPEDPDNGDDGGDDKTDPGTKPDDDKENDDGPISPIACRVSMFGFYDKLAKPPKYVNNLFTTKKVVENPTLEYYAENCESCKLVITSEDGNSVDEFIIDNSAFQNNLEPTTVIDEKNDRYAFEASNIKLDTKRLKSGNYILSINCFDPVLGGPVTGMRKFTNDEEFPPWLKLTIAPEIRWREVVPVINN